MKSTVLVVNTRPNSRTHRVAQGFGKRASTRISRDTRDKMSTIDRADYADQVFAWPDAETSSSPTAATIDALDIASLTYDAAHTGAAHSEIGSAS